MNKRVAIYARVSTDNQTGENQLKELRSIAERMQYIVIDEFIDEGISGVTSSRPALDALMKSATQRRFAFDFKSTHFMNEERM